jgi:hypothetical protein
MEYFANDAYKLLRETVGIGIGNWELGIEISDLVHGR